ncbi:MAG: hypothetical protein KJ821_00295 [Actinobacteria bacterium]|nr:hypothetical protein [Actinomycetota bacterium]MBU4483068.1 hypothetical protein [Actinomycetota bacterium]
MGRYKVGNWIEAAELFNKTGKFIIDICESAMIMDKEAISDLITKVADIEAEAYKLIKT